MRILGIDPGTSRENPTGLAILDWLPLCTTLVYSGAVFDPDAPLPALVAALDALPPVDAVACEAPWRGPNVQTLLRLAEVCGIAISFAARRGVPLLRCQPSQAKKAMTGASDADKAAVIAAVWREYGAALKKDTADAVAVAHWGAQQFSQWTKEIA